jgi:uncharacterized protein (DUF2062 family)
MELRLQTVRYKLLAWLKCGLAPRQLAFTLALGFAIGCIPLLGVTTGICAIAAIVLRLNMPAIQAANWAAMPFQVVLLIPFLRLGQRMFSSRIIVLNPARLLTQMEAAPLRLAFDMSGLFAHAILVWMIAAAPALLLMTLLLTPLMHRIARLRAAEAGD